MLRPSNPFTIGLATLALCALVGCGRTPAPGVEGSGSGGEDGGGPGEDGGTSDSGQISDGGGDAGSGPCFPDLDPDGVFGSSVPGVVISEVASGVYGFLEFYNRTSADIDLQVADYAVYMPFNSYRFANGASFVVRAHSHRQASILSMPGLPGPSPSGDEIFLYQAPGPSFGATHLEQYFCWGTGRGNTRANLAVSAGKWPSVGTCALAMGPGQSLHLTGLGTAPADYTASPQTPLDCP